MSAKIIVEEHGGPGALWWRVDLVAGDDLVSLAETVGTHDLASNLAYRWAGHLGLEVEERAWADLTKPKDSPS